jgi:hypothetical protein
MGRIATPAGLNQVKPAATFFRTLGFSGALLIGLAVLEAAARAETGAAPAPPDGEEGQAALLMSPAERRDRNELTLRELLGQTRWKWFGSTAVDWGGWRLHSGGVRITLVRPAADDVGLRRAGATAVGVHCSSLRQTWRLDGTWEPWSSPAKGSVGQRILLDLCSNTVDGPALPVPPLPPQ